MITIDKESNLVCKYCNEIYALPLKDRICPKCLLIVNKERQDTLALLERMINLDIYYDKQMAIKTLILAQRIISRELTIEQIGKIIK